MIGFGSAHAQVNVLGTAAGNSRYASEQVQAQLLAHAPDGIRPGQTVWVGLELKHQPHWHTYWLNSGDSGLPTQIEWQLPPGVQAGPIAWPAPSKFPLGSLANYGYANQVLLPTPLQVDAQWDGKPIAVRAQANWLACKTECIPEEATLEVRLDPQAPPTLHGRQFEQAWNARPVPTRAPSTQLEVRADGLHLTTLDTPTQWEGHPLEVFPEDPNLIAPGAAWTQAWTNGRWQAQLPLHDMRTDAPTQMTVVLKPQQPLAGPAAIKFKLPVNGAWPQAAATATLPPALQAALEQPADNATGRNTQPRTDFSGWLLAVLGAFLGGMLLNLMPCVFPILAIKVLAFSSGHTSQHRLAGLAYTLGVVVSFVALGGLLLALRAAGEQLGWGFQLQSPAVVVALAVLFTLLGLNLAGLFEMGQMLPSGLASLQARHPVVDAGLTGVLATAIASPCTAPFMGASLGLAVTLPWAQALAVFGAMGAGMALPYLAASWFPSLAQRMPRPGAWMERFKQLMAFPMWATVVWLLWVLGQQTGIDGAMALLGWLLCLAWMTWGWAQSGRARIWLGGGATAIWLALTVAWVPVMLQEDRTQPPPTTHEAAAPAAKLPPGEWHPWSPDRIRALRAAGTPVLVDFTAAWCVTCQYNKRTTLSDDKLLAMLTERKVVLLRADWTKRDPSVTQALAEIGRSGVPTYAVYQPNQSPKVLSELPSVSEIQAALALP